MRLERAEVLKISRSLDVKLDRLIRNVEAIIDGKIENIGAMYDDDNLNGKCGGDAVDSN